jgi:hypothetical protein
MRSCTERLDHALVRTRLDVKATRAHGSDFVKPATLYADCKKIAHLCSI